MYGYITKKYDLEPGKLKNYGKIKIGTFGLGDLILNFIVYEYYGNKLFLVERKLNYYLHYYDDKSSIKKIIIKDKCDLKYKIEKYLNFNINKEIEMSVNLIISKIYKYKKNTTKKCIHWKRARLIWVGHMKEKDNIWYIMPKDMVKLILGICYEGCFLYRI